jgi:UDP-N-acetyl-D-glucosamine dehydrogenase
MNGHGDRLDYAVIGLGYVGLPLALAASARGLRGIGFDVSESVVASLESGRSHVDDLSDADIAAMRANGFRATTHESELARADVIVICVPTPLAQEGSPDLGAVRSAAETVSRHVTPGTLSSWSRPPGPGPPRRWWCPSSSSPA